MRPPEHSPETEAEALPGSVKTILLVAAIASVVLALWAAFLVRPGLEEVLGMKHDPWGDRDRGVACMAGFTSAFAGILAAWQGWSGAPKRIARTFAVLGLILNLAVLLAAGIPFLLDHLSRIQGR